MRASRSVCAIAIASTMFVSACSSGDSSTTSPGSYVGNYTLVAIQGLKVPVGVIVNNVSVTVQGGSGTVNADNTFSFAITESVANVTTTTSFSGTWTTLTTNTFRFVDASTGAVFTGTFAGGRMTVVGNNQTYLFQHT
ncbi:MAG TPA: hypothetical protein VH277_03080 [Gemmatimonadaceae bacterium]|jgi:hypothetical protein|nr:hypothetical protein [Gemmatimonadaceae bacterium]